MADLFNQQISATYSGLLKTTSSGVLTSSLTQITDGRGNGSPLYISTAAINFYNAYTFPSTDGTADQVLKTDGAGAITWQDDANSGTVTSVALSVPTGLTVTGSPITTNGTITIGGTLGVANGGTGATTLTGILLGNGTSAISSITSANDGYILTADGVGGYAFEVASGGDVNVSGTPVADQIAIWTDATTIKGDPTLTIDTNREIILVQNGQSGTPSRGMYNIGGGNMSVATGEENTGFGKQNLNDIEGGYHNTAVGAYSLFSLTGGVYNVAIGHNSLYSLIDQSSNTAVGISSAANFTGANSTFIGASSGNKRLSGNNNTAIGVNSLVGNSTVSLNTGDGNTAIGFASLNVVSSGSKNVALGKSSGSLITTGSSNVIIGSFTGTTGESPTPVYDIRTSSNNIVISDGDGNIRQTFDNSGAATFSGNVGIGVTPSAWTGSSGLQVQYATVEGRSTLPSFSEYAANSYSDAGVRKYITNDFASRYTQYQGEHFWYTAPSGAAAGDTITFSPVLSIASTGAATFSGSVTANNSFTNQIGLVVNGSTTGGIRQNFIAQGSSGTYNFQIGTTITANNAFEIIPSTAIDGTTFSTAVFKILNTGAATFSGDIGVDSGDYNKIKATPDSNLWFENYVSGTGYVERVRITSGGVLQAKYGISFPTPSPASNGTPNASSVLDAYEEGTWTAEFDGSGISPNPTATGSYTRIGRICFISVYAGITPTTASNCVIYGLPFDAGSGSLYSVVSCTYADMIVNSTTGWTYLDRIYMTQNNSSSQAVYNTAGGSRTMMLSGVYNIG